MPDKTAPYEKAIEETAKTTSKALDLVKEAGGAVADIYGLIIGDQVHAARHRRLDEITRKTRKILNDRDLSETAEVAEQIAFPLLEAAQSEPRSEMQDLWARLLANAMDPKRRDDVRPEFVEILQNLHPTDARVLDVVGSGEGSMVDDLLKKMGDLRESSVFTSLGRQLWLSLTKWTLLQAYPSRPRVPDRLPALARRMG
jgi:hypothetical protein